MIGHKAVINKIGIWQDAFSDCIQENNIIIMTAENGLLVISLVIYMIDIVWNEFHKIIARSDGDRQTVSDLV